MRESPKMNSACLQNTRVTPELDKYIFVICITFCIVNHLAFPIFD